MHHINAPCTCIATVHWYDACMWGIRCMYVCMCDCMYVCMHVCKFFFPLNFIFSLVTKSVKWLQYPKWLNHTYFVWPLLTRWKKPHSRIITTNKNIIIYLKQMRMVPLFIKYITGSMIRNTIISVIHSVKPLTMWIIMDQISLSWVYVNCYNVCMWASVGFVYIHAYAHKHTRIHTFSIWHRMHACMHTCIDHIHTLKVVGVVLVNRPWQWSEDTN
jgi:hypothetical protein